MMVVMRHQGRACRPDYLAGGLAEDRRTPTDLANIFVRAEGSGDDTIASIGLLVNVVAFVLLRPGAQESLNLRGAYLIGAKLVNADLRLVDFIGADLRGADLSGANLTGGFFLTQAQVDAARGDEATKLPRSVTRPAHWVRRQA